MSAPALQAADRGEVTPRRRALGALATTLVAAALLVSVLADNLWALNGDFAHHFALVARLYEQGLTFGGGDPSLLEMNVYPRLAHAMAALTGRALASPVLGIHLVTAASLILLCFGLAGIFTRQDDADIAIQVPVLLFVLVAARGMRLAIHGREVVDNYFFAQVVAQALLLGVLALWLRVEPAPSSPWARYGWLATVAPLLAGVHAVPAVLLVVILAIIVVTDLVRAGRTGVGTCLAGLACVALSTALIAASPSFRVAAEISRNDGFLRLPYVPTTAALLALVAGVLVLSAPGLAGRCDGGRRGTGGMGAVAMFSTYGTAAALLTLLQCALLRYGYGSEYACKKYAFSMLTAALFLLAAHGAAAVRGAFLRGPTWSRRLDAAGAVLRPVAAAVVMAALLSSVRPSHPETDWRRLAEVDRVLREYYAENATLPGGRQDIALSIDGLGGPGDYLLTIADLHHVRCPRVEALILGQRAPGLARERYLVTSRSNPCNRPEVRVRDLPGDLVVLRAAEALHTPTDDLLFFLWDRELPPGTELQGLGMPELDPYGRWTTDREVRCTLPVPAELRGRVAGVRVYLWGGYVPDKVPVTITATLQDGGSTTVQVGAQRCDFFVPMTRPPEDDHIVLRLSIPGARSPASLGESADQRLLGVAVSSIELVIHPRQP